MGDSLVVFDFPEQTPDVRSELPLPDDFVQHGSGRVVDDIGRFDFLGNFDCLDEERTDANNREMVRHAYFTDWNVRGVEFRIWELRVLIFVRVVYSDVESVRAGGDVVRDVLRRVGTVGREGFARGGGVDAWNDVERVRGN